MINQSKPMNRSQENTNTQREDRIRKNHTPLQKRKQNSSTAYEYKIDTQQRQL